MMRRTSDFAVKSYLQIKDDNLLKIDEYLGYKCFVQRIANPSLYGIHESDIGIFIKTTNGFACAGFREYLVKDYRGEVYICRRKVFERYLESLQDNPIKLKATGYLLVEDKAKK